MKFLLWLSSECKSVNEIAKALQNQGHDIALLLIQDGVFLADKGCEHSAQVIDLGLPMYVSEHHVEERGIKSRLIGNVTLIDYDKMVDMLMEEYDRVVSI